MKTFLGILILSFFFISFSEVHSQEDRKEFRERLEKIRKEKLIEDVKLSETEAQKFIEVSSIHRKNVREIIRKRRDIEEKLSSATSDQEIEKLLSDFVNIDVEIASEKQRFLNELRTFLSVNQLADVLSFQKKFEDKLKNEFKRSPQKRRGNR